MFSKEKLEVLIRQFQRIFTLPLTRSTFRELQNAVFVAAEGDQKKINTFIKALLEGKDPDTKILDIQMHEFIRQFSVPARVAKEVQDRGEVLSMMTSDMGIQGEKIIFSTRVRRIDGGEFHFITDAEGFLQILQHYISRFRDASQSEMGQKIIATQKENLKKIRDLIDQLIQQ